MSTIPVTIPQPRSVVFASAMTQPDYGATADFFEARFRDAAYMVGLETAGTDGRYSRTGNVRVDVVDPTGDPQQLVVVLRLEPHQAAALVSALQDALGEVGL